MQLVLNEELKNPLRAVRVPTFIIYRAFTYIKEKIKIETKNELKQN